MSEWAKSSYSGATNCVETRWVKSTRCTSGTCVEAADAGAILVRDSKNPQQQPLELSRADWDGFLDEIQAGGFQL